MENPDSFGRAARHAAEVTARRRPDGTWELVSPRCALEREADLEEVRSMIAAGEHEIARDEVRWLLQDCSDNIAAHRLLGELALVDDDLPLARGHFGYAYQIAVNAIRRAGSPAPWPNSYPGNAEFFAAGKSLLECLEKLDKPELATEVADFLRHCNPQHPPDLRPT